jgi:Fic family protein
MSQSEVQQVEQHTGMKAEDLSEEQLDTAMNELGIEGQEPTDQEIALLEAEEDKDTAADPHAATATGAQPAPAAQADVITQLERLGALKAQGLLTEEEFAVQKAKLLGL